MSESKVVVLVERNAAFLTWIKGFPFYPGVNEVPVGKFEVIKNTPAYTHQLITGQLREMNVEGTTEVLPGPDMPAKQFIAVIQDTLNRDTLLKWQEADSRKKVLAAIKKQLAVVTPDGGDKLTDGDKLTYAGTPPPDSTDLVNEVEPGDVEIPPEPGV